jgi:putative transposase
VPNSRNGATPKRLGTEVGDIAMQVPRDRASSFEPRLVPKGSRRSGGLDEMIISLYAGGMTVRDIQHHLARTLGKELSHDTTSKITDEGAEEVKAWQARPLEEIYPIIYLDALVVKVRVLAHFPWSASLTRVNRREGLGCGGGRSWRGRTSVASAS